MDKDSEVETTDREEDANELEDVTDDTDDIAAQLGKMKAGTFSGQICTLKTLIDDDIVKIGDAVLSMDYMDKRYEADLLPSGCLRWRETKQVFSTPTSWVNQCIKGTINEGVKGMSAWSVIKYEGKRLDAYKLRWFRKQKKRLTSGSMGESATISSTITSNPITNDGPSTVTGISSTVTGIPSTVTGIPISSTVTGIPPVSLAGIANAMIIGPIPTKALDDDDPEKMMIRNMVNHEQLVGRHANNEQDMSILVKCVPFSALDRIQPFTMTISTNALLLIDFHCHLTSGEVTGYLGGTWDTSSHNLSILQGFPCRSRLADKDRSSAVEEEIRSNLESRNLSVVGWYHSHPRSAAHPSVKDIENQIEYQVIMKGETEANYVPCVGFISSPYDEYNPGPESCYQAFWIMPPPEYRPFEYGRPMQMLYTVTRDSFLTQDLLLEMRLLAHFYVGGPDAIKFDEVFKSLDQKVDDILDCLPSNGHEDETEERRKEKEGKSDENLEGRNNGTDEPNSSSEQTGGSQAALNEEEKKKEDEKNGKKEGGKEEEKNVGSKEEEEKESGITYWEKLQGSLRPNLPRDLQSIEGQSAAQTQVQEQALAHFWAFLRGLLIPSPS